MSLVLLEMKHVVSVVLLVTDVLTKPDKINSPKNFANPFLVLLVGFTPSAISSRLGIYNFGIFVSQTQNMALQAINTVLGVHC